MPRAVKATSAAVFVTPMAARLVQALPEGAAWMYEVKLDGYRALLIKQGGEVVIRSRNRNDLTRSYLEIRDAGGRIRAEAAVLDGEIVAIDATGRPSFQALQHRSSRPGHHVVFYAFDLLHIDGHDLTALPLNERRTRLPAILAGSGVLFSEELQGSARRVTEAVRGLGLEGVIAKRRDSRYISGDKHDAWVKLKLELQQEFVIGGYRPGAQGVDSLLVGFYEGKELKFAGKVRAGFTTHSRREVVTAVRPLHASRCPFADLPSAKTTRWGGGVTAAQMLEMQWLEPRAVAQIRFVEWTAEQHLRHAAFLGLRTDKAATDVRREI